MASATELIQSQPGIFKVTDLEKDQTLTLTIKDVVIQELGQNKEPKQVVLFEETPRGVALNMTRLGNLATLFGGQELKGQRVGVTRSDEKIQGKTLEILIFVEPEG